MRHNEGKLFDPMTYKKSARKETKETVLLIPRLEFCLPIKSEFWKTPRSLSFLINVNLVLL